MSLFYERILKRANFSSVSFSNVSFKVRRYYADRLTDWYVSLELNPSYLSYLWGSSFPSKGKLCGCWYISSSTNHKVPTNWKLNFTLTRVIELSLRARQFLQTRYLGGKWKQKSCLKENGTPQLFHAVMGLAGGTGITDFQSQGQAVCSFRWTVLLHRCLVCTTLQWLTHDNFCAWL